MCHWQFPGQKVNLPVVSSKKRGGMSSFIRGGDAQYGFQCLRSSCCSLRHRKGQNAAAQRVICPTGGRSITLVGKNDSKKAIPHGGSGGVELWGVPDKGKSQLIRWRWGRDKDLLELLQKHLGPWWGSQASSWGHPGLLIGMCHIRGLGHLRLFQKLG